MIASGRKLDTEQSETFRDIIAKVYKNPFEKQREQPQTAEEIKEYIVGRLMEVINGSA